MSKGRQPFESRCISTFKVDNLQGKFSHLLQNSLLKFLLHVFSTVVCPVLSISFAKVTFPVACSSKDKLYNKFLAAKPMEFQRSCLLSPYKLAYLNGHLNLPGIFYLSEKGDVIEGALSGFHDNH